MQKILTTKELSKKLHLAPYTLFLLRQNGKGPKFIKLGRIIRYRSEDVDAWMEAWTKEKNFE